MQAFVHQTQYKKSITIAQLTTCIKDDKVTHVTPVYSKCYGKNSVLSDIEAYWLTSVNLTDQWCLGPPFWVTLLTYITAIQYFIWLKCDVILSVWRCTMVCNTMLVPVISGNRVYVSNLIFPFRYGSFHIAFVANSSHTLFVGD